MKPPRRIQVRPRDNVAIVVNALGLPAGTAFPDGLVLNHFVPQGHKVALADIADGGDIIRYGEVIGTAKGAIRRGDWVNEDNVVMGSAPPLDQLEMATRPPPHAGAADRLHLRRLSQRRRHGGDQEYPGRLHQRAMRRRHDGICAEAHQGRAAAEISQCR